MSAGDPRREVCGASDNLTPQIHPGASGPDWSRIDSELDAMLPTDPDALVDSITKVLMRKAGRG